MKFRRLKKYYGYRVPSTWVENQRQNFRNLNRCKRWKLKGNQPKGLPSNMVDVLITLHKRSIVFMDKHMRQHKHYFI